MDEIAKKVYLRQVIRNKREWHRRVSPDEKAKGFRDWHSRGYLPHFDFPGIIQFITYFDRYIRDEEHLHKAIRYIESNPVKARLFKNPEDWPWGSARMRNSLPQNQQLAGEAARAPEE